MASPGAAAAAVAADMDGIARRHLPLHGQAEHVVQERAQAVDGGGGQALLHGIDQEAVDHLARDVAHAQLAEPGQYMIFQPGAVVLGGALGGLDMGEVLLHGELPEGRDGPGLLLLSLGVYALIDQRPQRVGALAGLGQGHRRELADLDGASAPVVAVAVVEELPALAVDQALESDALGVGILGLAGGGVRGDWAGRLSRSRLVKRNCLGGAAMFGSCGWMGMDGDGWGWMTMPGPAAGLVHPGAAARAIGMMYA